MTPEQAAKYASKWRDDSPDYPPCAECGDPIGSEGDDEEAAMIGEAPEVAIRVFRKHPRAGYAAAGKQQELAFHRSCASREGLLRTEGGC